jgi:hypothetical protein
MNMSKKYKALSIGEQVAIQAEVDDLREEYANLRQQVEQLSASNARMASALKAIAGFDKYEPVGGGSIDRTRSPLGLDEDDCQIQSKIIAIEKLRADHIAMSAIAHRLAIELECLVMDTKDLSVQSKWWETSMAVLSDWHDMWNKDQQHVSAFGKD